MTKATLAIILAAMGLVAFHPGWTADAAAPVRVMILDGESGGRYHDWARTTPALEKMLDETGLFEVTVISAPPAAGDFRSFKPDFAAFQVVVMNYDAPDDRWPAELKSSFEQYMSQGGGLVVVHGADNAFAGWPAFNEMIGVGGWRGRTESAGPYWYYKDGTLASDMTPGRAGSHGRRVPFQVTARAPNHAILRGLPRVWMHQGDEVYANLRGPGKNMTVLATAFSDPANAGSGRDEPQLMVVGFGKGRVFHTTMGHDINALSSVGFVTTFQRGTEWAATGTVTQKVPASFPTGDTVAYRADIAAMDPGYKNGLNSLDVPGAARQNDPNQKEWLQLFNGRDLSDWVVKFAHHDLGANLNDTFRIEDGLLKVRYDKWTTFDREFGHIFYKQPFSYYLLAAEYRFVGEQLPAAGPTLAWARRNNGLMLHSPDPKTMLKDQDFPISIEVQLLGGLADGKPRTTANLCTPGTHVVLNGTLHTPHCTNSTSKTYDGDQWVRVEVLVHGDELIRHMIDGQTVLEYTKPQIGGGSASPTDPAVKVDGTPLTGGYISLQAETGPTDFRKVELMNLEGCTDPKARNYKTYFVKSNASMCRY